MCGVTTLLRTFNSKETFKYAWAHTHMFRGGEDRVRAIVMWHFMWVRVKLECDLVIVVEMSLVLEDWM